MKTTKNINMNTLDSEYLDHIPSEDATYLLQILASLHPESAAEQTYIPVDVEYQGPVLKRKINFSLEHCEYDVGWSTRVDCEKFILCLAVLGGHPELILKMDNQEVYYTSSHGETQDLAPKSFGEIIAVASSFVRAASR
jgi:hypothetical protein